MAPIPSPAERRLRALSDHRLTLVLAGLLVAAALGELLLPGGPAADAAGGLRAAEQAALQASGLQDPLGSGWVRWVALLLLLQLGLRTARATTPTGNQSLAGWLRWCGLVLALGGGLWLRGQTVDGTIELAPGESSETCRSLVAGRSIDRFLGQQLTLAAWDGVRGEGLLEVRPTAGQPVKLPFGVGRPVSWGGWRFVPLAEQATALPSQVTLRWQARDDATPGGAGTVTVPVGEQAALGPDRVVGIEAVTQDRDDGLGPAVRVAVSDRTGETDRRWLLLRPAADGDPEAGRGGPVQLAVTGAEFPHRLELAATRNGAPALVPLGLLLLAGGVLASGAGRRRTGAGR